MDIKEKLKNITISVSNDQEITIAYNFLASYGFTYYSLKKDGKPLDELLSYKPAFVGIYFGQINSYGDGHIRSKERQYVKLTDLWTLFNEDEKVVVVKLNDGGYWAKVTRDGISVDDPHNNMRSERYSFDILNELKAARDKVKNQPATQSVKERVLSKLQPDIKIKTNSDAEKFGLLQLFEELGIPNLLKGYPVDASNFPFVYYNGKGMGGRTNNGNNSITLEQLFAAETPISVVEVKTPARTLKVFANKITACSQTFPISVIDELAAARDEVLK